MKKIKYILLVIPAILLLNSCADRLDTYPTHATSPEVVFSSVESAESAINGIYRYMQKHGYTTAHEHHNFGQSAIQFSHDLAADNMLKRDMGSGWFFWDYDFTMRTNISHNAYRPGAWWNFYYKIITSANNILAFLPDAPGNEDLKANILGQAYSIRAFAYYYLINCYQLTYFGNENSPGVPVYTEPTDKDSQSEGRGTVKDVYTQINSDLAAAIVEFEKSSTPQKAKSHIDKYVTYGLMARTALMQHDYAKAKEYAEKALSKPDLELMTAADAIGGFNSVSNPEMMWGFETIPSQATGTLSFMYHIDSENGGYALNSGAAISRWLYDALDDNDIRKQHWFNAQTAEVTPEMYEEVGQKPDVNPQTVLYLWENKQNADNKKDPTKGFPYYKNSYIQTKFRAKGPGIIANDMYYMRAAEMHLIIAEASCLSSTPNYGAAVAALNKVMEEKLPTYDASTLPQAQERTIESYATEAEFAARNLLDEVYFQRRIELWGEGFGVFDISRLKRDMDRTYPENNFTLAPIKFPYAEKKWEFVMMLPDAEIQSNTEIGPGDQNP